MQIMRRSHCSGARGQSWPSNRLWKSWDFEIAMHLGVPVRSAERCFMIMSNSGKERESGKQTTNGEAMGKKGKQ